MSIAIVLLCAGGSSRLGEPKQHTLIGNKTLLQNRCEIACTVQQRFDFPSKPLVVCGHWYAEDRELLRNLNVECIANTAWNNGQPGSLQCALKHRKNSEAVLVMLIDQYRVTADDLTKLITTWQGDVNVPAAAEYARTIGAPVIWPSACKPELLANESAPKLLLQRIPHTVVPMPNAAWDLDTPTDRQVMFEWYKQKAPGI